MAFQSIWYFTDIPKDIVDTLTEDVKKFDSQFSDSKLYGDNLDKVVRDSKNTWIPTAHWIGGFLWYYINRANRENFLYDLTCIDGESIQYTQYGEGQFYNWHIDAGIDTSYKPQQIIGSGSNIAQDLITVQGEYVRKLSFSLQLSDPEEYTGGEVQFVDTNKRTYFAPKQRGTLVLFDSRTSHRVRKVKSGVRRSLVGWVVGPRWK
jgi:PKHD-type hydroxylase